MDKMFPPLPKSDAESIARNSYDSQFQKGSRDFWRGNYIEQLKSEEKPPCKHFFIKTSIGAKCKKCHMGWTGKTFTVKNGKLYIENQEVEF